MKIYFNELSKSAEYVEISIDRKAFVVYNTMRYIIDKYCCNYSDGKTGG